MERFLFDLNEILASNIGITQNYMVAVVFVAISVLIGVISFFLAIRSIIKLFTKKREPKTPIQQELHLEAPTQKEINIEIGELGKIISDKKVSVKGIELDYFILKKSKYEKETLPIGTIVVIIKQNANEAYVKPADEKDKARHKEAL